MNSFHKLNVNGLLTPPGTPQAAPLVSSASQVPAAPAKCTIVRSASTIRPSKVAMNMDKTWMYKRLANGFIIDEYFNGVEEFVNFAKRHPDCMNGDELRCPCNHCKCRNKVFRDEDTVKVHLGKNGFVPNYYNWYCHGEPYLSEPIRHSVASSSAPIAGEVVDGSKKNSLYGLGSQTKVVFDRVMSNPKRKDCLSSSSTELQVLRQENQELRDQFATLKQSMEDQIKAVEDRVKAAVEQSMEDRIKTIVEQQMQDFISRLISSLPFMNPSVFPTPHDFNSQETQDPNNNSS